MSLKPSASSALFNAASSLGFQATNLWNFAFLKSSPTTDDVDLSILHNLVSPVSTSDSVLLTGLIQSVNVDFPKIKTEVTPFNFTYFEQYEPISDIKMSFLETNTFTVLTYMQEWFDQIYDVKAHTFRTVQQGQTDRRYRNGMLTYQVYPIPAVNTNNAGAGTVSLVSDLLSSIPVPTAVLYFENLMLKGIDSIEANYSSAELLKVSATFACDKITLKTLGV
jgi:hypothetical protein